MFSVDDKDKVIPFDDLAPSSVGAPIPVINSILVIGMLIRNFSL